MNEELVSNENTLDSKNSTISNVLIGVLLVIVAVLAFNFFRSEPVDSPTIANEQDTIETSNTSDSTEVNADTTEYTVAKGDNLWKIAQSQLGDGFLWTEIAKANGIDLTAGGKITVGQKLQIPQVASVQTGTDDQLEDSDNQLYVVAKGDNLWKIAKEFYGDGEQWVKIYEFADNAIQMYTARDGHIYPRIEPGDVLVVPGA